MEIIRFARIPFRYTVGPDGVKYKIGEIAFSEEHLFAKLNGDMAEVEMPEEPWWARLWYKIFPSTGIHANLGTTYSLKS